MAASDLTDPRRSIRVRTGRLYTGLLPASVSVMVQATERKESHMRKVLLLLAVLVTLVAAPAASAHQVTPPGQGAPTCTTNVHAGDPTNPAHSGGMRIANSWSDAISGGACPS